MFQSVITKERFLCLDSIQRQAVIRHYRMGNRLPLRRIEIGLNQVGDNGFRYYYSNGEQSANLDNEGNPCNRMGIPYYALK